MLLPCHLLLDLPDPSSSPRPARSLMLYDQGFIWRGGTVYPQFHLQIFRSLNLDLSVPKPCYQRYLHALGAKD